ncbi:hypothetical protein [uncultured Imperialibacter sp.]|uniref:P27 family phage terminase small subunit n=1 Tax=uncultured Imperialibacter sp. TaxID=1672639 RepID=UPI0030DC9B0E|tara:strand:- start:14488 stop:14832 length:345 start_codon:yes stop_codon:yes gene_type:complete
MISITDRKYKTKKRELEKFLKEKGQYEKVDSSLIDQLIYQLFLFDLSVVEMEKGLIVKGLNGSEYLNPAFKANSVIAKNIGVISTKMNITPQERKKLEKDKPVERVNDGYDEEP